MIFKDRIIKLPSGQNLNFFATNENSGWLYFYKNGIKKKQLIFGNIFRCISLSYESNCEYVKQISDDFVCMCFDGNISIVKNEN